MYPDDKFPTLVIAAVHSGETLAAFVMQWSQHPFCGAMHFGSLLVGEELVEVDVVDVEIVVDDEIVLVEVTWW